MQPTNKLHRELQRRKYITKQASSLTTAVSMSAGLKTRQKCQCSFWPNGLQIPREYFVCNNKKENSKKVIKKFDTPKPAITFAGSNNMGCSSSRKIEAEEEGKEEEDEEEEREEEEIKKKRKKKEKKKEKKKKKKKKKRRKKKKKKKKKKKRK